MPRIYRYNTKTCRYEPQLPTVGRTLRKVFVFLFISFLLAATFFELYSPSLYSLHELALKGENESLQSDWFILRKRTDKAQRELAALIEKDDHNYRVILDKSPLPPSMRLAGTGGREKINTAGIEDYEIIYSSYKRIDKLSRQLDVEVQSFEEIISILEEKTHMWLSRPAIQPIDNRQLDRLHLTYGPRLHPLYGVIMDHKGLDFTAPEGTPVYATGDGRVHMAYYSDTYGKVIFLDHGHGFETRYAHLNEFAVSTDQQVKRGQVIGYVGNTGTSVSSHLHYEVLINGEHTNPVNFFQRDLSNEEYQHLVEGASGNVMPLD